MRMPSIITERDLVMTKLLRSLPLLAAVASVLLASCSPGRDLPPLQATTQAVYRLGPGDHVRIIVYGNDQLSKDFRINDTGGLDLPLVGTINAKGLSTQELKTEIGNTLMRENFVREPSVSVEVISYRPIFILGEVSKPGQYSYQPGMTVLTAVAVAGGYTYRAYEGYAAITRTQGSEAVEGRVTPQTYVAPGDVIRVFERTF
jgi:polysaccharide export outer membrane protein